MPRFDIYPMPGEGGRGYILDVQADLLTQLVTRVVVPLLPLDDFNRLTIRDLNPILEINGVRHIMVTQAIATVPLKDLQSAIMSLADKHILLTRALDILLTGI